MFVTLGEGWQGFGPKQPAGLTSNIIPRSPIAVEGILPTGGLLVGIGCLSPALASLLRNAIVAHVLRNVEHEVIGYYTVFLSQGPAIF